MNLQNQSLLKFNNLTLSYGDKTLFDDISGIISKKDRIGLIGVNGSGKTSLIEVLRGNLKADHGEISFVGKIGYVAQLDFDSYRDKVPLYVYLQKQVDDWWNILIEYTKLFDRDLDENQTLDALSGGELVKVHIILALQQKPDILFLDEPTNHLDLSSLKILENILHQLNIPLLVVSHNISFLNSVVNTIWEIDNHSLAIYGGNYDFYKSEKDRLLQKQVDLYEVKKKDLAKDKTVMLRTNVQYQRKQAKLNRMAKENDRSIPKIMRNNIRLKVQQNYGSKKIKTEQKISESLQQIKELKPKQRKNIHLAINSNLKKGLIINIANGSLVLPNSEPLLNEINFNLYHQDRIAILGDNGSGKTTFVKQLEYKAEDLLKGELKYGAKYDVLYVDQKYDLIKPDKTIFENIQALNPDITYENARKVLGNMGFTSYFDINKLAFELSGGETSRLAFAIATNSNVEVLVLDEPTNNLDIDTINVITKALCNYKGTLIVISHDMNFLNGIGIQKIYTISNKKLFISNLTPN